MTDADDLLGTELARLARALRPHGLPVLIGGGYGLVLRQKHVEVIGVPTRRAVPEARATSDLDVFLTAEVIADASRVDALRETLHQLAYRPVETARYFQFVRDVDVRGAAREVKVDLLAPPPRDPVRLERVKVDATRIRPRAVQGIHARTAPEAFMVGECALGIWLGADDPVEVFLPHPFSFVLLKLFAYRDRQDDKATDFGRYHAFDLYRIVAMMTDAELLEAEALRDRYADDVVVVEAREIISTLFGHADAPGGLALREHARQAGTGLAREDVSAFTADLDALLVRR